VQQSVGQAEGSGRETEVRQRVALKLTQNGNENDEADVEVDACHDRQLQK